MEPFWIKMQYHIWKGCHKYRFICILQIFWVIRSYIIFIYRNSDFEKNMQRYKFSKIFIKKYIFEYFFKVAWWAQTFSFWLYDSSTQRIRCFNLILISITFPITAFSCLLWKRSTTRARQREIEREWLREKRDNLHFRVGWLLELRARFFSFPLRVRSLTVT